MAIAYHLYHQFVLILKNTKTRNKLIHLHSWQVHMFIDLNSFKSSLLCLYTKSLKKKMSVNTLMLSDRDDLLQKEKSGKR